MKERNRVFFFYREAVVGLKIDVLCSSALCTLKPVEKQLGNFVENRLRKVESCLWARVISASVIRWVLPTICSAEINCIYILNLCSGLD